MKKRKFKIPVIDLKVTVYVYRHPQEIWKEFDKFRLVPDVRDMQAFVFPGDDEMSVCFLHDKYLTHGVVAHECLHVVNKAFANCAYKAEMDNDEMQAYFLTYVVDQVYKILKLK